MILSELLCFWVADDREGTTAIVDLAIRQLDTDYPPITHLIYHQNRRVERVLLWGAVRGIE